MRVDQASLADLEVLSAAGGAPGLVDHLDHTRTRAGRDVFRRRITRPLKTSAEIRSVQASLGYISGDRSRFDDLPGELEVSAVARYLDSRFATLRSADGPAATFEAVWTRFRYPDLYGEVDRGLRILAAFLKRMGVVVEGAATAPGPLGEHMTELGNLMYAEPLAPVGTERRFRSWRSTLLLDRAVRERGRPAVLRALELAAEVDALVSMADAGAEHGLVTPEVSDDTIGIEVEGLFHPFVDNAVRNSIALGASERLLFLTGPNMAGKTTFLKSCGIVALLAHAGMGVPATHCRLGRLDRLISAIRTEDNLRQEISYFQAEARRVKELAKAVTTGDRCMVIADELFRGTNVKDARDASLLVLESFVRVRTSCFLVASHLVELADTLGATPGVLLRRFEAKLEGEEVAFPYQLQPGASGQRLGMKVLEREGVVELLEGMWPDARNRANETCGE